MPTDIDSDKIFAGPLQTKVHTYIYNLYCHALTYVLIQYEYFRFMFHFTGVRQTNRLDKPEWYFTQILNWGKETHLFVGKTFQNSAVKAGKVDFNIRVSHFI